MMEKKENKVLDMLRKITEETGVESLLNLNLAAT